jgi:hypothetical protein
VPAVVDLAQTDDQRQILALFASGASIGTSVMAPPLPPGIAKTLRKSFLDAVQSSAFVDEARKMGVDIDPLPGEELQKVVERTFEIPAATVKRARDLSQPR